MRKRYLLVSDFDQTLSFDDTGHKLSEALGIGGFGETVHGLSQLNLVQEGAELAYLLRHDPEYRRVRREHLATIGGQIRLKRNIARLVQLLASGIEGMHFDFYVVSAAPEEVVHAALRGLVPPDHVIATRFDYEPSGEIAAVTRVPAGYGKVMAVDELRLALGIPGERVVYVGDGTSDLHVMLHVNRIDGLTIAASESRSITQIARRTVISDDALSVLIPILEELCGHTPLQIRELFERHGMQIQEWDRVRTDWLTISDRDDVAETAGTTG
ncbi:MAG TPA: HAD family hydrolase [Gemmatimonadaceae bacterium]|nr:HAD family hydrolase [Gemmatimonadaceae bacterium]